MNYTIVTMRLIVSNLNLCNNQLGNSIGRWVVNCEIGLDKGSDELSMPILNINHNVNIFTTLFSNVDEKKWEASCEFLNWVRQFLINISKQYIKIA